MIGEPPVLVGANHVTNSWALPLTTPTDLGALDTALASDVAVTGALPPTVFALVVVIVAVELVAAATPVTVTKPVPLTTTTPDAVAVSAKEAKAYGSALLILTTYPKSAIAATVSRLSGTIPVFKRGVISSFVNTLSLQWESREPGLEAEPSTGTPSSFPRDPARVLYAAMARTPVNDGDGPPKPTTSEFHLLPPIPNACPISCVMTPSRPWFAFSEAKSAVSSRILARYGRPPKTRVPVINASPTVFPTPSMLVNSTSMSRSSTPPTSGKSPVMT